MKKQYIISLLSVFVVLATLNQKSFADQRPYVWTYGYMTVERGHSELESYFTLSSSDTADMKGTMVAEHQIELEVGMTERFDFAIYQVFTQKPNEGLKYTKLKLRARFKIGQKEQYLLDPLLYLEYQTNQNFSEYVIEFKPILAKDIGRLNIALNPILELEHKGKSEFELGYAIGSSYEFSELLKAGLEIKGSEYGHYIGPVISHGREDLWVTAGSAFKMGNIKKEKPEFQIRLLLGIGFGGKSDEKNIK